MSENIAIILPTWAGGGAELVARQWATLLAHQGNTVTIVLTHGAPPLTDPNRPYSVVTIQSHGKWKILRHIYSLSMLSKHRRFTRTLAALPYCNLVALAAQLFLLPRNQVFISEHTLHANLAKWTTVSRQIQWAIAKYAYRHADGALAVSHPVAAELAATCRIPSSRLWVLPNPILDYDYRFVPRDAAAARGTVTVVVPSRLVAQKNVEVAIDVALKIIETEGLSARVEYFGEGHLANELALRAKESDLEIVVHGWVESWWEHVPPDAVVFLPSEIEGFGNVLVEAAARSIPSVATSKALGVADACIPGVTGVLTLGTSVSEYAGAIVEASQMIVPNIEAWLQQFRPERIYVALSTILELDKN